MQASYVTDTGKTRSMNQDYGFCTAKPVGKLPNLFMVADGMGGHKAGDFASRFTVDHMNRLIQESVYDNPIVILNHSIRRVNRMLYEDAQSDSEHFGMGTTLALAVVFEDQLIAVNVGDSRIYLMSDTLRQISEDHSLVEELIRSRKLERGSAEYKDKKNVITRAMGAMPVVVPDIFEVTIKGDEQILICSDGLTNMVSDDQIEEVLRSEKTPFEKAELLVQMANDQGGMDNITVILANLGEGVKPCCE